MQKIPFFWSLFLPFLSVHVGFFVWIVGFFSFPPSIFFPEFLSSLEAKRVVDIFADGNEVEPRQIQGLGEVKDNLSGAENTAWELGQCGAKILHRVRYFIEWN